MQNLKTKKWTNDGTITSVRTTSDGTIASYDIETSDGSMTTRNRRYIQKVHKPSNVSKTSQSSQIADKDRAITNE